MNPTPANVKPMGRHECVRALLILALLAAILSLQAQDTNTPPPPGDVMPAEEMLQTNEMVLPDDLGQPDNSAPTNDVSPANNPSSGPTRDARARRLDRQRQRRPSDSSRDTSPVPAAGGTNTGPASLDYSAFRMVADRNIFDPNRISHAPGVRRARPKTVESFTLVGIMSYEKGTFAFFDGTSSEYRKALKQTDSIAGYKVAAIAPNSVKLTRQTNQLELKIGMQLRREEDGPWFQSTQTDTYASSATATTSSPAASAASTSSPATVPSGPDSDIIKKMMQRREQE